ncbi:MAG: hypothetical protein WCI87_10025 [Euryarchaeota archaeon]
MTSGKPLLFPGVAVIVIPLASQKLGRSIALNSMPVTHLALFQKYRRGTKKRTGQPCSGVSEASSCLTANNSTAVENQIE